MTRDTLQMKKSNKDNKKASSKKQEEIKLKKKSESSDDDSSSYEDEDEDDYHDKELDVHEYRKFLTKMFPSSHLNNKIQLGDKVKKSIEKIVKKMDKE